MRIVVRAVSVALAGILAACGGGKSGDVTSSSTISNASSIVSGYDDSPVHANVTGSGGSVTIAAPGFLTLETAERAGRIRLFPNDGRMTLQDTFQYLYGGNEFNALNRLGDSTKVVSVVPSGVLAKDRGLAAVQLGVKLLNEWLTGAGVPVRYEINATSDVRVDVAVDPTDQIFLVDHDRPGAVCYTSRQGNVIVSGRVVVFNFDLAIREPVILHELAHSLGLGHSIHPGPMMNSVELYNNVTATELDQLYLKMVYSRLPGTKIRYERAAENDRSGVTASDLPARVTDVTVCAR